MCYFHPIYVGPLHFIFDWLAKDFCWPLLSGNSKGVLANIHVLRLVRFTSKVQKDQKGVGQHSSAKIMEYMLVPFILFWFAQ